MEGWIADRLTWMDNQIALEMAPAPPLFNRQGGPVAAGFELTMTAAGPIYYTLDGPDPRTVAGPIRPSTGVTLVPENAPKRVFVPTGPVADAWRGGAAFDDSAWTSVTGGPGVIGYNQGARAGVLFSLNIGPQMYNINASCYVRVPFTFADSLQSVGALTLEIRYNDGFVAYLNGVEIARRNFTGTPAWNSAATAQQADPASYEDIPILNGAAGLRCGANLLAIQGLNSAKTNSDFAIAAELLLEKPAELQAPARVKLYTGPVRLSETTRIKARALVAGRWSALNEAFFTLDPTAQP